MKLRLKKKSKKLAKVKTAECFNCGHPFFGNEKFCPECGQINKNPKITFGSFVQEVFNGFISWDSKFWTTFIPLLTKPGKVSRDYIDGKRQRYANPFRFYLTISVLFFLIIGATESYDKFDQFRKGETTSISTPTINQTIDSVATIIDPTSPQFKKNLNTALKKVDSTEREELLKAIPVLKPDSIKNNTSSSNGLQIDFIPNWGKFYTFQKKHPKIATEIALDSLKVEHTFFNRFLYSRVKAGNEMAGDNDKLEDFKKQMISYTSISLFIFLPLFTLFLKFFYVRRKFTYVEHLVFVFHTQTVFFLLSIIFYLLYYFSPKDYMTGIFLLLFIIYLYLAMRRFYQQGRFKTFLKFILINFSFFIVSTIGAMIIMATTFIMY